MVLSGVLVVDNNRFYTRLIADHLKGRGFTVREANSGAEALRLAEDCPPDLLILDLIMPEIDGVQVCEYLRRQERLRSIPIIVLSGILPEEIEDLRHLGARAFVAKMQAEKILDGIDQAIDWIRRGEAGQFLGGFDRMFRREVVQELLQELRARNGMLESLSEGAAEVSSDGTLVYCNEIFARLLGRRAWDLLNRTIVECFPAQRAEIETLVAGLRDDPASTPRLEVRLDSKILELRAAALRKGEDGRGLVLLLEDVTLRRQAERDKERLQIELLQNEKLSSLGRLISGVAHELNNPLTGVIGYSQLLLGRSSDARIKRQLERIYSQACRCQKVIQNLITFGQKHLPVKRHLGLNGILKKVLEVMEFQLKQDGIRIVTDLDPKLPLTMVDYDQMRQVFMNVIDNAHQAMLQVPERVLTVRSRKRDAGIHLEFEDSGPGVPQEMLTKLFEPFFTTREVGKGMGLGLSVSYSVVREHGGEIRVANAPRGGTLLSLDLPVLAPDPALSQGSGRRRSRRAPPRVLVVDDEPVILDLMVDLLTERDYRVDTAGNGREALEKLSTGAYDAILLDLKMPEMDGRFFFQEIGRQFPALASRVVFATGDTVDEETRSFIEHTKQPLLSKPFEIDKVLATLSKLIGGARETAGDPALVSNS
jgi:PAS domain S-box-containing protein